MSTLCQIFLITASDKPKIGWVHRWHKLKFWDQNELALSLLTRISVSHKILLHPLIAISIAMCQAYACGPSIYQIYNSFWSAKVGKQRIAIHFEIWTMSNQMKTDRRGRWNNNQNVLFPRNEILKDHILCCYLHQARSTNLN